MEFIQNTNIQNKKVLLRCDLNVTIKENHIIDNTKIKESLETINYLLQQNCSIIILSHLGKIKSEEDKKEKSLKLVWKEMEKLLERKIIFINNTRSDELTQACASLKPQEILLIENTRFEDYPDKKESNCDEELSKYWASLANVFVNDAFGTTHRKHASNYGVSKYLKTYYGCLINKEIKGLNSVLNPVHPFMVIMGGAKVEDKIQMIKSLLKECDTLIVGGGIANTFLKANNIEIGKSLYDENYLEEIKTIYKENKSKIILPKQVRIQNNENVCEKDISQIEKDDNILDIVLTEEYFASLKQAKTVFVNGTLGFYENPKFSKGTKDLLDFLSQIDAKVIIGGGDALASVNKLAKKDDYYFISTGGGATLEYIKSKKLLALEGD